MVNYFRYIILEQNCPGGRKDFRVREVVDIEENLWCPRLGVKGKVDMTVELEMAPGGSSVAQVDPPISSNSCKYDYCILVYFGHKSV